MAYDFRAAVAEASALPLEPFEFTIGEDADGNPRTFQMPVPIDLLAIDQLGRGNWIGAIREILGPDQFAEFTAALRAEGQRLTLDPAKALMDEYMAHSKTTVGESEASTEPSPNTATQ